MPRATEEMKLIEGVDFYREGAAFVFTERYHLRRGNCCENNCRHCPYGAAKEELRPRALTTTTDEKSA
jgi:2-iminoacetate synthase ThiH